MITDAITFVSNKELTLKDSQNRSEFRIYLVNRDEFAKVRGMRFERASLKTRHTDEDIVNKLASGLRVFDLKVKELNGRVVDLLIEHGVLLTTDFDIATVLQILVTDKYTKVGSAIKVYIDQNEDGEIVSVPEDRIVDPVKEKKLRFKEDSEQQSITTTPVKQVVITNEPSITKKKKEKRVKVKIVESEIIRDVTVEKPEDNNSEEKIVKNSIEVEEEKVVGDLSKVIDPKSTDLETSLSEILNDDFLDQVSKDYPVDIHSALTLQLFKKQLFDIFDNREFFLQLGVERIVFSGIEKISHKCKIERTWKGLYYVSNPELGTKVLFVYSILSQDILFHPHAQIGLNSLAHLLNVALTSIARTDAIRSAVEDVLYVVKRKDFVAVSF